MTASRSEPNGPTGVRVGNVHQVQPHRAARPIPGAEDAEEIRIPGLHPIATIDFVECPQPSDLQVAAVVRQQGVANHSQGIDPIVDQRSFLIKQRLAPERETQIQRTAVIRVQIWKQLTEVPFEE